MADGEISGKPEGEVVAAKADKQGNPVDGEGNLIVEAVGSVDEITDDDFTNPERTVGLPVLPKVVSDAIGSDGRRVIIKKNIFERNKERHADVTPSDSRTILRAALYSPDLYGQTQPSRQPYKYVLVNIPTDGELYRHVLLEVEPTKENIEIVHWYYLDEKGLEKLKKQAAREDGQLLILPSDSSEEVGALSDPTSGFTGKGSDLAEDKQVEGGESSGTLDSKVTEDSTEDSKYKDIIDIEDKKDGEERGREDGRGREAAGSGRGGFVENEFSGGISEGGMALLDTIGRHLGVEIRFAPRDGEELRGANGKKRSRGGKREIIIADDYLPRGGDADVEGAMRVVLGHELTHHLRKVCGAKMWQALKDAAVEVMGKERFEGLFGRARKLYDDFYDKKGLERLSDDDIAEEVIVEECGRMLMTDEGKVKEMLGRVEASGESSASVAKRVLDWISEMLTKLKGALSGKKLSSEERAQISALERMRKTWEGMYEYAAALEREASAEARAEERVYAEEARKDPAIAEDIANDEDVYNESHSLLPEEKLAADSLDYYDEKIGKTKVAEKNRPEPLDRSRIEMTREDLERANSSIGEMREYVLPYYGVQADGNRYLPDDTAPGAISKSTIFPNGSYGKTVENTLICDRTLAYNEFVNAVKDRIKRPLTARESFLASQMVYDIATDPQCLYCYVSLDRKAYDEYLLRYVEDRDRTVSAYNALSDKGDKEAVDKVYNDFLRGRKDTKNMRSRFDKWCRIADEGGEFVTLEELRSAESRDNARGEHPWQIKDAEAYAQGASWAKKEMGYRSYNGELLRISARALQGVMSQYGLRFYSFSEYSPAFIVENMQQVRDGSLRGLKGFAYTKKTDFARIFASTGMNINISCYGRRNANGEMVADTYQGADWEEVKALREEHPGVGSVFVVTNDADLEWALEQDWIDVIIPFHIVRTGEDIAKFYEWTNYTSDSADRNKDKKDNKHIYPHDHLNDKGRFLSLCEEHSIVPRFADVKLSDGRSVVEHPNYMRLVNETRRNTEETPLMRPEFDMESAKRSFDEFIDKGGYYGGYWANEDAFGEGVEQVVADIESGREASEVEYGRQDIDYDKAMASRSRRLGEHGNKPLSYSQKKGMLFEPEILRTTGKGNSETTEEKFSIMGEQGAMNLDASEEATTRMDNLGVAREMETEGKDALTIKQATGWERGADGKWRYEVPDGRLAEGVEDDFNEGRTDWTLEEFWNDDALFEAYPELRDYQVTIDPDGTHEADADALFDSESKTLTLSDGVLIYGNTSVIAHEIQHAIQEIEGFAKGTTPTQAGSIDDYTRSMGEVEARNVQSRMGMSEKERRQKLLSETEDVAREDQIFLRENLGGSALHGVDSVDNIDGVDNLSMGVDSLSMGVEGTRGGTGSEVNKGSKGGKELGRTGTSRRIAEAIAEAQKDGVSEPTDAQKEAGNYKKAHVKIGNLDISIENPIGSTRSGKDAKGNEWSTTMQNSYGYIRGTESVDGDHIDVFLNDEAFNDDAPVFVIDQTKEDGSFDEHKVMLGFNTKEEAMQAYLNNYDSNWMQRHPGIRITETSRDNFDKWIESSHRKTKPFADYKMNGKVEGEERFSLGEGVETFESRREAAVKNRGTVVPGLNEAEVKVVDVPRHGYKGYNVLTQAVDAAKARYSGKTLAYDNHGQKFFYNITGESLTYSANHASKSTNIGVHVAVMDMLDSVINESIEVMEHPDVRKKGGDRIENNGINPDALMHRFIGVVRIDRVTYRVITTMKEVKGSDKAKHHTYEVVDIEAIKAPEDKISRASNGSVTQDYSQVRIAKLLKGSEIHNKSGEKILEESKLADENRDSVAAGEERYSVSGDLDRKYPTWLSGQTTGSGQHTTQITSTQATYKKIGEHLKGEGVDPGQVSVLDASSGLGVGTQALRDMGFDVEDVEPYPSDKREAPTYSRYEDIDKKYDVVISNAVLNVIPDDWRSDVLHSMADKLKVGGRLFINVRDAAGVAAQKQKIELDSPSEILVTDKNGNIRAYQKGFTKKELLDYVREELGEGFEVEVANAKNSGMTNGTAVVVTRKSEGAEERYSIGELREEAEKEWEGREVSVDDYHVMTRADFEDVSQYEGKTVAEVTKSVFAQWRSMKESGQYDYYRSPSGSAYLVDRATGDVYRLSNHWGEVSSCDWTLDGKIAGRSYKSRYGYHQIPAIGKCNVEEMERNVTHETAEAYVRSQKRKEAREEALRMLGFDRETAEGEERYSVSGMGVDERGIVEKAKRIELTAEQQKMLDEILDKRFESPARSFRIFSKEDFADMLREVTEYSEAEIEEIVSELNDDGTYTREDGSRMAGGYLNEYEIMFTFAGTEHSAMDTLMGRMHEELHHRIQTDPSYRKAAEAIAPYVVKAFPKFAKRVKRAYSTKSVTEQIEEMAVNGIEYGLYHGKLGDLTGLLESSEIEDLLKLLKTIGYDNETNIEGTTISILDEVEGSRYGTERVDKEHSTGGGEKQRGEETSEGGARGTEGLREGKDSEVDKGFKDSKVETEEGEERYSVGTPVSAREYYDRRTRRPHKGGSVPRRANLLGRLKESYLDSMRSLNVLMKAVMLERESVTGIREKVATWEDAMKAENRMSSLNKAESEVYERDFFNPMTKAVTRLMKAGKMSYDEVLRYMIAKHGLERNEVMARRDAKATVAAGGRNTEDCY